MIPPLIKYRKVGLLCGPLYYKMEVEKEIRMRKLSSFKYENFSSKRPLYSIKYNKNTYCYFFLIIHIVYSYIRQNLKGLPFIKKLNHIRLATVYNKDKIKPVSCDLSIFHHKA